MDKCGFHFVYIVVRTGWLGVAEDNESFHFIPFYMFCVLNHPVVPESSLSESTSSKNKVKALIRMSQFLDFLKPQCIYIPEHIEIFFWQLSFPRKSNKY